MKVEDPAAGGGAHPPVKANGLSEANGTADSVVPVRHGKVTAQFPWRPSMLDRCAQSRPQGKRRSCTSISSGCIVLRGASAICTAIATVKHLYVYMAGPENLYCI